MPPESWSGNWFGDVLEADQLAACRRRAPAARAWRRPGSPARTRRSRSRVRWASRPKCWNTIETVWRRRSRSAAGVGGHDVRAEDADRRPAVGSISRISVRTSVDLPEPERPMTTNTSPGQISSETSRTATVLPLLARSSPRDRSASGLPTIRSPCGPNTFQRPGARAAARPAPRTVAIDGLRSEAPCQIYHPHLRRDRTRAAGRAPVSSAPRSRRSAARSAPRTGTARRRVRCRCRSPRRRRTAGGSPSSSWSR